MARLVATGCAACNAKIAAALATMPARAGFIEPGRPLRSGAQRILSEHKRLLLDGEEKPFIHFATVGKKGLVLTHEDARCACGSEAAHAELWRGIVTHEPRPESMTPHTKTMTAQRETWEEALARLNAEDALPSFPAVRVPDLPYTPEELRAQAEEKLKIVPRIELS